MAGKYTQEAVFALFPPEGMVSLGDLAHLGDMPKSQMRRLLEAMERKAKVYKKEDVGGQYWGILTEELAVEMEVVTPDMSEFKRRNAKDSSTAALPKPSRLRKRKCGFCKEPIPEGASARYIYPVPSRYGLEMNEGEHACSKCAPPIEAEQVAEGLLVLA